MINTTDLAVPDLIRDLIALHNHEVPEQVRDTAAQGANR